MYRLIPVFALVVTASGCLSTWFPTSEATTQSNSPLSTEPFGGSEVLIIDYWMVERLAGSSEIDRDVWQSVDEMVVESDRRTKLEQNGFRCGTVGGLLPVALQELLKRPRSVVAQKQKRLSIRGEFALPLVRFPAASATPTAPDVSEAILTLSGEPIEGGNIRLRLKSHIQTTKASDLEGSGVGWLAAQKKETIEGVPLEWTTELSPNQFVLLGTRYSAAKSMGHQFFLGETDDTRVQRMMAIRVCRGGTREEDLTGVLSQERLVRPARLNIVGNGGQ